MYVVVPLLTILNLKFLSLSFESTELSLSNFSRIFCCSQIFSNTLFVSHYRYSLCTAFLFCMYCCRYLLRLNQLSITSQCFYLFCSQLLYLLSWIILLFYDYCFLTASQILFFVYRQLNITKFNFFFCSFFLL